MNTKGVGGQQKIQPPTREEKQYIQKAVDAAQESGLNRNLKKTVLATMKADDILHVHLFVKVNYEEHY